MMLICKPHCRFFKPGEKEKLSCFGYDFIAERAGEAEIEAMKAHVGDTPPARFEHDERIEAVLCARCEFREADCDFMGGESMPEAVPCGGYVLLAKLLAQGCEKAREWIKHNCRD